MRATIGIHCSTPCSQPAGMWVCWEVHWRFQGLGKAGWPHMIFGNPLRAFYLSVTGKRYPNHKTLNPTS